jgi:hypothetical protein
LRIDIRGDVQPIAISSTYDMQNSVVKNIPISINKRYKVLNQYGDYLTNSNVDEILSIYPDLQRTFNSGINCRKTANAFGSISGFCLGYGVGYISTSLIRGNGIETYVYYI